MSSNASSSGIESDLDSSPNVNWNNIILSFHHHLLHLASRRERSTNNHQCQQFSWWRFYWKQRFHCHAWYNQTTIKSFTSSSINSNEYIEIYMSLSLFNTQSLWWWLVFFQNTSVQRERESFRSFWHPSSCIQWIGKHISSGFLSVDTTSSSVVEDWDEECQVIEPYRMLRDLRRDLFMFDAFE